MGLSLSEASPSYELPHALSPDQDTTSGLFMHQRRVYAFGVSRRCDVRTDGSCCPPSWALPPGRSSRTLTPWSAQSGYETVPERRPRWFHTSAPLCPLARSDQK